MMNSRKLRERQAAMKASQPVKPWGYHKVDTFTESTCRLNKLLDMGMSDEFISNAFSINVKGVRFLREVRLGIPKM